MKILFLTLAIIFGLQLNCLANPSNSVSISYPAVANAVIASAEYNANNNEVQTKYNSHSHIDIDNLATVTTGVWAATPINYPFLELTDSIVGDDLSDSAMEKIYPVGSIYISTVSTNPAALFGFGTWTAFAEGRVLIGVGTSDAVYAAAATGGASTVTLTAAQSGLPAHTHAQDSRTLLNVAGGNNNSGSNGLDAGGNTGSTGGTSAAEAHTNLMPYVVVYCWHRDS